MENAKPRIAVVTMGVKLGNETRGYTRFRFLSELLCAEGFDVDLITSSFQHWEKAQRDVSDPSYREHPFRVVFINEPGYKKNLDLSRIMSHKQAAKNLKRYFESEFSSENGYDLIYAEIPPNDVALACAEVATAHNIPFVVDVNDLWPEAMRMVVDVPVISDIAFHPFARDAKKTYELISAAVGTSDEYALRPSQDRSDPYRHVTVYVGNDLAAFDKGAREHASEFAKPENEFWVSYAGTLGASYDLETLIRAAALLSDDMPCLKVKILGDGPDRERLEGISKELGAPVDFLGHTDYPAMAACLCASDVVVNSLVKTAAQSIVTKIGDYLASKSAMINTGSSPEFRNKVESQEFGLNVEAENAKALSEAIKTLAENNSLKREMSEKGRKVAELEFDQPKSYMKIVELIRELLSI